MKIIEIENKNLKAVEKEIVKAILDEKVILSPTDTVYGLISLAKSKKAVQKIYKIKKRPKNKPLPLFIGSIKKAKEIAIINKKTESLLKIFWPGKITVILKRKKTKEKLYGILKKTVALRIPKFDFLQKILKDIKSPLAETSANISSKKTFSNIDSILNQFDKKNQPDIVLKLKKIKIKKSKPSIIIDLTKNPPLILR